MASGLEKKIRYIFSTPALLETALTHSSLQNDHNERLEFLGDRVLGLAVADLLFSRFPAEAEGSLAKRHAMLVQQEALVQVAQEISLPEHLKLSPAEKKAGGNKKDKIVADALEALIGAIYIDSGPGPAQAFVAEFWGRMLQGQVLPPEDAKSQLQEWAQARGLPLPEYKTVGRSGSDHAPLFEIEVSVKGEGTACAAAASKRAAEKAAAHKMLEKIGNKA
jgi:ribonuclease-3